MNSRETQVKRSRLLISDKRLSAFFQAAQDSKVFAIMLINEQLNNCKSIDEVFYDGDDYGYSLNVKKHTDDTFTIHFGCLAGPDAGDGGKWSVAFNGDNIDSITALEFWIS